MMSCFKSLKIYFQIELMISELIVSKWDELPDASQKHL